MPFRVMWEVGGAAHVTGVIVTTPTTMMTRARRR